MNKQPQDTVNVCHDPMMNAAIANPAKDGPAPATSLKELMERFDALDQTQVRETLRDILVHLWTSTALFTGDEMMEGIHDTFTELGLSCENHRPFEEEEEDDDQA